MCLFSPYEYHMDILVDEALETVIETYQIDPSIILCFSYKTYSLTRRTHKWVRLSEGYLLRDREITPTTNGTKRDLTFDDLKLHRNIKPGTLLTTKRYLN